MTRERDESHELNAEKTIEEAGVWIRDTLGRRSGGFYHLGYSSARPIDWEYDEDLEDPSHMEEFRLVAEGLGAHGQGDGGLVVLVTDEQGSGRARCFLAFQVARLLGEGGARVLIVDGEFAEDGPGEWLGDSGREGLVDIARYGASPRACLQRLTIPNVQLMGVGSFRPEHGGGLIGYEIEPVMRQLRSNWDFVLCTAPPRNADGSFNPLFHHGDGVLMGVSLKGEARDRFEDLADYLLEEGVKVFGVMAFSELGEARPPAAKAPPAAPREEPLPEDEDTPSRGVSPYAGLPRSGPHQSSRVFRNVALSIVVALVAFLGLWFGIQWLQRPDPVELPPLAHERDLGEPVRSAEDEGELQLAGGSGDGGGEAGEPASGNPAAGDAAAAAPAGSTPSGSDPKDSPSQIADARSSESSTLGPGGGSGSAAGTTTPKPPDTPPVEEAETLPEPAKVEPEPAAPTEDPLRAGLFRQPRSGYALHLWSFPDSSQALPSVRKLRAEGYRPVVKGAQIRGKGRWFRVLIGDYATKREATQARSLLSDRSDIDYIGVLKVGG